MSKSKITTCYQDDLPTSEESREDIEAKLWLLKEVEHQKSILLRLQAVARSEAISGTNSKKVKYSIMAINNLTQFIKGSEAINNDIRNNALRFIINIVRSVAERLL